MSEETRQMSQNQFLNGLLDQGRLNAGVFFSGTFCGDMTHEAEEKGFLHLVRKAPVRIEMDKGNSVDITMPGLALISDSLRHRMICDEEDGVEMVCAHLSFENLIVHPRLVGLPALLVLPFHENVALENVAQHLFQEAFDENVGSNHAVNLLVELLLIYVFRHCLDQGIVDRGILGGLADPKLTRVLIALQQDLRAEWNVEKMAATAGMSRANFAAHFKTRIGTSPASYLATLRLTQARQMLANGQSLKAVTEKVGYKSTTALSRSFHRHFGQGPREIQRNVG